MALKVDRIDYSLESLMTDNLTKEQLMAYIANCEGLFDDDVNNILYVLSMRFSTETTKRDRLWFVLLATTTIHRQIHLGLEMLESHTPKDELLPYYVAIHELAMAPDGDRNMAKSHALLKILQLCNTPITTVEKDELLEHLRAEYGPFLAKASRVKKLAEAFKPKKSQ